MSFCASDQQQTQQKAEISVHIKFLFYPLGIIIPYK